MTATQLVTKNLRTLALAFCLTLVGGGMLTACEQGPAEKAGKEVDNALENAGDAINEAADDTGDAIEDAADDTRDAFNDATN